MVLCLFARSRQLLGLLPLLALQSMVTNGDFRSFCYIQLGCIRYASLNSCFMRD